MHINYSGFQQFLLRLSLSFLLLLGGSSVVMAQFATMKISDPDTKNIYWYRLKDVKRSSQSGTHAYMAWTGPTSQTLASAYGMKDDNQLWCIVDDPNSNGYLLYNKAAGFSAALRRGHTKDQLKIPAGNDRGYSAFITPGVFPDNYKGEPFLFTTYGKPTEKAFALTYYRDRWQYPSSTFVGTFGKTANGGFNFNVSGQEVQIMWFESEPAGQLDNTDLDYYPLINAKGTVGGLTKEAVRELERLHVQLINDFNDANVQAVKAEAAKLRATSERVPLDPNKYYYIRSAHLGFFGPKEIDANSDNDVAGKGTWKKPVIYVDAADSKMKWRLSTNSDDELWQVIVTNGNMASGTIQLKNKATGKYFSIWDASSTPNSAYPPNIRDVNTAIYPGHSQVWIQAENYSAHAENHLLGEGTGGNMTGYDAPDADPSDESVNSPYNYKRSNNVYLPGASVWLFEASNVDVVTINPLTEQEKIDVRRLIWGSGKPGGITSENIATLVNLWNNGNPTNPNAVRTEFDRLIKLPMEQRVPFESGYYRIKNGHDEFNNLNKTAALYEDTDNQPKWKTADTGNSGIYYLKNMGGNTYEVINITTGRYYNGAGTASVKTGQKAVEISPVNEAKYAGYFKIVSSSDGATYPLDNSAHANDHQHGAGTGSGTINYKNPDGGEYAKYNFTLPSNASYPGASTWMFERVTPPNDYHDIHVKNVLNAKNVVEGFTAEQLEEFERLETLYRNYGAGFGTAVMAEVERLVQLPKEQRIQYKDGFYIIKNGSYEFYERDANKVVIMNARTDSHNVGSIGWEKKETATAGSELDEVWYVEKQADGLYTFTNLKTLTKIQEFNHYAGYSDNAASANLVAKDMQIKLSYRPDETYHPGQFLLQNKAGGDDNEITANPQGTGNSFDGNQSGPVLSWHGVPFDHHSAWMLRKVEEKVTSLSDYQTAIKNYFLRSENRYGGFTTEALSNLKTITNPYRLVEEINKLRKNDAGRVATTDGYVRISSAAEAYADASKKKNVYLKYNPLTGSTAGTVANGGLAWNNADRTRVDEIWEIEKSGNGATEYTLQSPNTEKYVRDAGGVLGEAVNGNIIALDPDLFPAMFEMNFSGQTLSFLNHGLGNGTGGAMGNSRQVTDGTQSYYWAKSGTEMDNINQYSTFYFEPATDLDLKVVGKFASFNYPFNVKFDAQLSTDHTTGIRAYRSKRVEKDHIKVVPIEGQVVNAETPVIIETDAPTTLKLTITNEGGDNFTDNVWEGSLAPQVIAKGTYILIPQDRTYNSKVYPAGFYPTTTENSTINPNRIYITAAKGATPVGTGAVRAFYIEVEDDTTTGITGVDATNTEEDTQYYDLSGRRVVKPTKGIYLTTDGRKVYINK